MMRRFIELGGITNARWTEENGCLRNPNSDESLMLSTSTAVENPNLVVKATAIFCLMAIWATAIFAVVFASMLDFPTLIIGRGNNMYLLFLMNVLGYEGLDLLQMVLELDIGRCTEDAGP